MKYKKQILVLFGTLALITYVSFQAFPILQEEELAVIHINQTEQLQVYVLDNENTLLPVTKTIEPGTSIEEKLTMMIESMLVDHVQGEFTGLLGSETILVDVVIENACAYFYFDDTFATYAADQELHVMEALVWGATQFPEINSIQLYMNDTRLTKMPVSQTPIPNPLTRDVGINHFETATSALHKGDTITVFYTKEIANETYFVPKSKRIESSRDDMQSVVQAVLQDTSVSSQMKQPLYEDNIDSFDLPRREKDTLIVNMSNALLESDRSAKQSAYEALVLSLANTYHVDKIMVYVDDNVVSLHGSNEEALSVSSLSYNPIPF